MKATVIHLEEDKPVLKWEAVPDISCGPEEVRIDVHATAVNRADLLQARGLYPPPPGDSEILGLEVAGVIADKGEAADGWKIGDRVCALAPGGGYAEQTAVHHQMLLRLPDDWSFAQGAAIPEAWLTAFSNLFTEGKLASGETVLIHAGAGGVGTAAIQLAREADATVIITAGAENKLDRCRELGATLAISYKTEDFAKAVMAETANKGVDLILDCVGAPYLEGHLRIMRPNARLVSIGVMGGRKTELDMARVLGKSLRIIGSRLRARPRAEKIRISRQFQERFWPLLVSGKLRPVIDTVFPIREADAAHAYVRQNRNIGKVILEIRKYQ